MGSPSAPKTTSAQKAFEIEQRRALDTEIQEENRRRKALSRGQLGAVTLLSGLDAVPAAGGGGSTSSSVLGGETSVVSAAAPGVNKGSPRAVGGPKKRGI